MLQLIHCAGRVSSVRAKNKDLEAGARVIAEDFRLPAGRRKAIAKLVRDHLDWFGAAEARGLVVADILRLLTAAGATYEDGSPIKFTTLSNALWRRRTASAERNHKVPLGGERQKPGPNRADGVMRPASKHARRNAARRASTEADQAVASARRDVRSKSPVQTGTETPSKSEVLGFMHRAAALRRPARDPD